MMRSGTHLVINVILNNFQRYKKSPLYVNLDMFLHLGGNIDKLSSSGGSVVKTHFPQAIECRGHETEIMQFLKKQKVILVRRDPQEVKRSLKNFGEWGAKEVSKFDQLQKEFDDYWQTQEGVLILNYADLIQLDRLAEIIKQIEQFTGIVSNQKIKLPLAKNKRFGILFSKAMTRLLGRYAPYVNTGIKLGR